jgi:YcaO-like protein with predicted kinase domain
MYSKYKDRLPSETIENIQNILKGLPLSLEYEVKERINCVFSATLTDKLGKWNTSGKGTTKEYCLASAYGECIEHLCNYRAYDYTKVSNIANAYGGFNRFVDEKILPMQEIDILAPDVKNDMIDAYKYLTDVTPTDGQLYSVWKELLRKNETEFVPYYSVKNQKTVFLPDVIISFLCGSNGGGAGNTPEEAIGHALDEIVERYVKYQIYLNQLTPPDIPIFIIQDRCLELLNIIKEIENMGNYRIIVKDASLGKGFSALCVLMVDYKEQRYLVNFGAHPCFEIALERCLTELLQSYMPGTNNPRKKMEKWNPHYKNNQSVKNWVSLLRDDTGKIPKSFFNAIPSWEYQPWEKFSEYNNKFGMDMQIRKLLEIATDIYIRDIGYLGMPTFYIYIPQISVSHLPFDDDQLKVWNFVPRFSEILRNPEKISVREIEFLSNNFFNHDSFVGSLIFKNLNEEMTNALHAALLLDMGETHKANVILNSQDDSSCYCAACELELSKANELEADRDKFLSLFFSEKDAEYAMCWRKKNVFVELINYYIRKGLIIVDEKYSTEQQNAIDTLHMRLKDRQLRKIKSIQNIET